MASTALNFLQRLFEALNRPLFDLNKNRISDQLSQGLKRGITPASLRLGAANGFDSPCGSVQKRRVGDLFVSRG